MLPLGMIQECYFEKWVGSSFSAGVKNRINGKTS
jgi:hypothetical protein